MWVDIWPPKAPKIIKNHPLYNDDQCIFALTMMYLLWGNAVPEYQSSTSVVDSIHTLRELGAGWKAQSNVMLRIEMTLTQLKI